VKLKVDPKDIMFVSNILMGYDGMVLLKTISEKDGIVELMVSPGCEEQVIQIINSLGIAKIL